MSTIYVVRGSAVARTAMASYDAALAAANVHNYNLLPVSSVIPEGATVEEVDSVPDLGRAGDRVTVVEARTTTDGARVSAGLGWTTGPGPGLFYEAAGADPAAVRETVEVGLAEGRALREWEFDEESVVVESAESAPGRYATAVALAVYGRSEPLL